MEKPVNLSLFFSLIFFSFFADHSALGQAFLTESMEGVVGGISDTVRANEPAPESVIRKRLEIMGYTDVGALTRPSLETPIITNATDREGKTGELIIEPITGGVISFKPNE